MADGWKKGEVPLEIVKLAVQVITVIIGGWIAFRVDAYKLEVASVGAEEEKRDKKQRDELEATRRNLEIANQTRELEIRRNDQRQRLLIELSPRILGATGKRENCVYVTDAWTVGMGEPLPPFFEKACQSTAETPTKVSASELASSGWAVLAGYDTSKQAGCFEVKKAESLSFVPARLLPDWNNPKAFRTVVGAFATRSDAEQFAIAVRAQMRPDALAVDLGRTFKDLSPLSCP
jgi:hypothetical protein